MTNPISEGVRSFFWRWTRFAFDGWALLAALLFLVVGFVLGYEVSQPARYSAPAQLVSKRLDALEDLLIKVRGTSLPNVHAERGKLSRAIEEARNAIASLPSPQRQALTPHFDKIVLHGEAIDDALESQSNAFDGAISGHLKAIRTERERMEHQIDATEGVAPWIFDQSKRFLKWIGALSFLTILAAISFVLLMNHPRFRRLVARSSGSISAFGVSFNFSDVQSARDSIETRQRALGEDLARAYTRALRDSAVEAKFKRVYDELRDAFRQEGIELDRIDHRATLYVPDFLGEYVVQATRYSGNWRQGNETVVGRRFSVRYGIIGKAWRLTGPQYYSEVRNENKNLVRNWGFTPAEASPFANSPSVGSLMAFVVKDTGSLPPLAIVYVEAEGANMLHDPAKLTAQQAMEQTPNAEGFTPADRYAADQIWAKVADKEAIKRLKTVLVRLQSVLRWNDKVDDAPGR